MPVKTMYRTLDNKVLLDEINEFRDNKETKICFRKTKKMVQIDFRRIENQDSRKTKKPRFVSDGLPIFGKVEPRFISSG
ncbi:unnamed protein product [Rhizophagus irregularis]|nr:unnamed protein product [Rhizophagus irregularis]